MFRQVWRDTPRIKIHSRKFPHSQVTGFHSLMSIFSRIPSFERHNFEGPRSTPFSARIALSQPRINAPIAIKILGSFTRWLHLYILRQAEHVKELMVPHLKQIRCPSRVSTTVYPTTFNHEILRKGLCNGYRWSRFEILRNPLQSDILLGKCDPLIISHLFWASNKIRCSVWFDR